LMKSRREEPVWFGLSFAIASPSLKKHLDNRS
jgi:hypothetical protein